MGAEDKNTYLDASGSENEVEAYKSDDEITKGGRSAKRRKVDNEQDASDDDVDVSDDDDPIESRANNKFHEAPETGDTSKLVAKSHNVGSGSPIIIKPLTKKNLVASEAAIRKSGVVYISRIPPGMKPSALRSLLSPYGKINRTFLAPEDPAARARRKKAGGNKRVLFTEGWVEFVKKKEAKAACELLNGRNIGGKKGSFFRDDIWNLVYLKGFKWHNLTEQITTENAERANRIRAEISKSTKENKTFVRNVEEAKMLDGMQAKAKKRKTATGHDGDGESAKSGRRRSFAQLKQVRKTDDVKEHPDHVTRVLSKIF